jgi:hypothetical protein
MSLRSSHTIDHFEKHGQLLVPRAHYELHFDEEGQDQLFELAEEASRQILDKLPDTYYYPAVPMNENLNRAHHTIQEVSQFSESELLEFDKRIQHEALDTLDPMQLEIGREIMVGEDSLLFSIDPRDELSALREEILYILGLPPNPEKRPHVTLAYAKRNPDTSEVCRLVDAANIRPATVSVGGLRRIMQWSTGEYYEWEDEERKFLPFGRRS